MKYLKTMQEFDGILKRKSLIRKNDDPALEKIKKIMEDPKELEKYLKKMQDEKNSLQIFVGEL
jgi:putative heme degradation protein